MTAKEIITKQFDRIDYKVIKTSEIQFAIREAPENEWTITENIGEFIVFDTWPYKCELPWELNCPRDIVDERTFEAITSDVISYWESRIFETVNPYLKALYSGMVFKFKETKTSEKPSAKVVDAYISSLIECIKNKYINSSSYHNVTYMILEAHRVALQSNKLNYIPTIKDLSLQEYTEHKFDDSLFELMVDNFSEYSADERISMVNMFDKCTERLFITLETTFIDININVHLLARYFHQINDRQNLKKILDKYYNAYTRLETIRTKEQRLDDLKEIKQLYTQYEFVDEAHAIVQKRRELRREK